MEKRGLGHTERYSGFSLNQMSLLFLMYTELSGLMAMPSPPLSRTRSKKPLTSSLVVATVLTTDETRVSIRLADRARRTIREAQGEDWRQPGRRCQARLAKRVQLVASWPSRFSGSRGKRPGRRGEQDCRAGPDAPVRQRWRWKQQPKRINHGKEYDCSHDSPDS